MPAVAWLGVVLVVAAGTGLYLRNRQHRTTLLSRAAAAAVATTTGNEARSPCPPLPTPTGQPVVGDPADALLRAAPTSDAEHWVAQADAADPRPAT